MRVLLITGELHPASVCVGIVVMREPVVIATNASQAAGDSLTLKGCRMENTQTTVAEPAMLLDVQSVASLLGVSGRHVYRLADAGKMPRPLKLGGAVRWDRDVVRRWIESGCPSVVQTKGGRR